MPAHMSMHPKSVAQECVNGQQVFNGFGNCSQRSQKQIYSGIFQQQHQGPTFVLVSDYPSSFIIIVRG
jgi:hypothetical protein